MATFIEDLKGFSENSGSAYPGDVVASAKCPPYNDFLVYGGRRLGYTLPTIHCGDSVKRNVKTVLIQLCPRPAIHTRTGICQSCNQPLVPLTYRIRINTNSMWHIRCYEDLHNLEQELIDNSAILSIDENQIDIEALAYIYQWEADVLGIDGALVGAYAAAMRSNQGSTHSDGVAGEIIRDGDEDYFPPSHPGATYVLEVDSDEEFCCDVFEEHRSSYDGSNQPIADYYLNQPLQPIVNGCFASIDIGPTVERDEDTSQGVLIPRFPARLSDLLDALEKKPSRTLRDHAVFMFR